MADVGGDAVTWWVAVYGAVVSTLAVIVSCAALVWTIHRDRGDIGKLKIDLMVVRGIWSGGPVLRFYAPSEGPAPINLSDRDRLFITITNVGRRTITASKCRGFQGSRLGINRFGWRRQGFIIPPLDLPKALQPGDFVMQWLDDPNDILPVRVLYVWDSTGETWRVSRRALRRIKSRVRQPEDALSESGPPSTSSDTSRKASDA